ncbi:MAG: transposase [Acidobacteriota bacterium]
MQQSAATPATSNNAPLAYFITFSCYGSRLHGDDRGSVDKRHNQYGEPFAAANKPATQASRRRMTESVYEVDAVRRELVLQGIRKICERRSWHLLAAHVRTRHVHSVLEADKPPERVMSELKAAASRELNESGVDSTLRRWSRHGSTVYLWETAQVVEAIDYVVRRQGEPMAVFLDVERGEADPLRSFAALLIAASSMDFCD